MEYIFCIFNTQGHYMYSITPQPCLSIIIIINKYFDEGKW